MTSTKEVQTDDCFTCLRTVAKDIFLIFLFTLAIGYVEFFTSSDNCVNV
jgi:hypothetical protein